MYRFSSPTFFASLPARLSIAFLFLANTFCFAQSPTNANKETSPRDNSTFSLAAQLAEIENRIESGDKTVVYALRDPEFAPIKALLDNTTRWKWLNTSSAINQTLLNRFAEAQRNFKAKEASVGMSNAVNIDAQTQEFGAVSNVSNAINSFGIPSQSQLILGTAAFLAERFKTEITLHYLQKMQNTIDQSELKYLFPQTRSLLNFQSFANQQQIGVLARTAFEQDLHQLTDNFMVSLTKEDGFGQYLKKDPSLQPVARYVMGTSKMFKAIRQGNAPIEIIEQLSTDFDDSKNQDFDKTIHILQAFAENLTVNKGKNWVSTAQLRNSDTMKYVLALTYHNNEELAKNIGWLPEEMEKNYVKFFPRIKTLLNSLQQVEHTVAKLRDNANTTINTANTTINTVRDSIRAGNYQDYIGQMNGILATAIAFLPESKLQKSTQTYLTLSQQILKIHQAAESRQYNVVLNNLVQTLSSLYPKPEDAPFSASLSKVMYYGSFMIEICNARDERQVQRIMNTYAMPVGSYSVKRKSEFSIGVQAYVGGFGGGEWLTTATTEQRLAGNVAFAAPIGIDIAKGNANGSSFSCFITAVDLGALVSFRMGDSNINTLPEVRWENVLAPGIQFMYGLPKSPLSIGIGGQIAPALRKYSANGLTTNTNSAFRLGATVAIDIPIFNLYTKNR
jgi:hypothetical protein